MENSSVPATLFSWIFRFILLALAIYAVYWTYQKLYSGSGDSSVLMKDIYVASPTTAYTFDAKMIPPVFNGGRYTISSWVYISNFLAGRNKEILKLGDFSSAAGTLVAGLYLDANDNVMHVLTSSQSLTASQTTGTNETGTAGVMTTGTYNNRFKANVIGASSMATDGYNDCKVSPIAFQRWVHIALILDGKTCDVYVDGKLARSCILSSQFMGAPGASIKVGDNGGFGGYVSGIQAMSYAMNPEEVYRTYQAGPLGAVSLWEYIQSFFDPKTIGTLDYPKMN
jgi:hypothetical protein